jgi:Mn-containing catalase
MLARRKPRHCEIALKQKRLLDLHLDGDITTEQFRSKSAELEEPRVAAEGQLEAACSRLGRLKDIERSKRWASGPSKDGKGEFEYVAETQAIGPQVEELDPPVEPRLYSTPEQPMPPASS